MKLILILFLLPFWLLGQTQLKTDTIINNGHYKSYFCYKIKEPLYVTYKLYKGGGDCDRTNFNFKNDTKIVMATSKDYSKSGYDKGHLVNAEDYAYDCLKDESTFRYYNCLPQTPNLNRGIWKVWEEKIREESQKDSLFILCGGTFANKIIGDSTFVPEFCWKIVYSLTTKKPLYILVFTNTMENASVIELKKLNDIKKTIKYKINFLLN